jgi:CheY-like chemotaxis protein
VDVSGLIIAARTISVGGSPTYRCLLCDGTGTIDLLFLGRPSVRGLEAGRRCSARGMAATFRGRLAIWNPRYMLEPVQDDDVAQIPAPDFGPSLDADEAFTRVLVIDDDPAIRRVIALNLTARGYHADLADCGSAAIGLLARAPELVLLDLGLPDIDGLELITAVRDYGDAPIIVISAQDSPQARIAAMDAGAEAYVTKPFAVSALLSAMEGVLGAERIIC